jgi:hypothetical protein
MAQISRMLRSVQGDGLMYWCQGCEQIHVIYHGPGQWKWDGNLESPTIEPSVLVTSGHYVEGERGRASYCHEDGDHSHCFRCHTFIRGGMVEFLNDCTHRFAGQRVPLPPLPDYLCDEGWDRGRWSGAPATRDRAWLLEQIRQRK